MTKDEALKLALKALERVRTQDMELVQLSILATNAIREALAQPEQEPCRHRIADIRNEAVKSGYMCMDCGALFGAYTTPPHRKPLTDKQIQYAFRTNSVMVDNGNAYMVAGKRAINIARAIEAAHGIKE